MRRLRFPAAFVLILLFGSSAWAQRGGMRGGMSAGGGFARGGAPVSGRAFVGSLPARRPLGSAFRSSGAAFQHAPGMPHHGGIHPVHVHNGTHIHFRTVWPHSYWGYPGYAGLYYPFFGDWYGSSEKPWDDDAQQQTARQIDELSQEVQRLREAREAQDYPRETASAPAPRPQVETTLEKPNTDLPIVLVFLDKHIQEIKNYAVMNETLMVYDGPRTHKIPLMDIDLAATLKLNDERGVAFSIPN